MSQSSQPTTDTGLVPDPAAGRAVTHNDDGTVTVTLAPIDEQYAAAVGVARAEAFTDTDADARSYGADAADRIADGVEGVLAVAIALGVPPSEIDVDARDGGDDGWDLSLPMSPDGSLTDITIKHIDVKRQSDMPILLRRSKVDTPSCDLFWLCTDTDTGDGITLHGCVTPEKVQESCRVEDSPVPDADHCNYVVESDDMCACPVRDGSVPVITPGF